MNCPRCGSDHHCKDGIIQDRQRYKCKDCSYHYTVKRKSDVKPEEVKRMAFEMYLEGLGFRTIGRILKISHVTVFQWVKKWGENFELPRRGKSIEVIELDEMHAYVAEKKTTSRYGLLLIDIEKGLSFLSVAIDTQKQN